MLLSRLLSESEIEYVSCKRDGAQDMRAIANIEIENIFCDSRQVVVRGLYIALDGLHTDSHGFVGEAASHGALAAVVSRRALDEGRVETGDCSIVLICVEDCREAMARIYAAFYGNPQRWMTFVGVTGTNGKTTVSRMIYEILTRAGNKCGLIGTVGTLVSGESGEQSLSDDFAKGRNPLANMTTPDPAELYRTLAAMRERGVRYVIMEVTSHALSFKKVAPIEFEVGVFTNLTEDHLDFHRDMEGYYLAKRSLFDKCRKSVINVDDKYGRRLSGEVTAQKFTCSCEGRAAYYSACDVRLHGEKGIEYRLASGRMRLRIRSKIPGGITVINTLEAAAACDVLGIGSGEIKDSIATLDGICGRLEKLKLDERVGFSVYVDYAHTPDALENLLRTAKSMAKRGQRIVLLFGCGGDREKQKRALMGKIASEMADFFIVTSDNSRSENTSDIINDIVSGIGSDGHYTVIEDREKAIDYAIWNSRDGDILLLAGKGHEEYQIDKNGKRQFSERQLVNKYVKKYHG